MTKLGDIKYLQAGPGDIERISKFSGFEDFDLIAQEYFSYMSDSSVFYIALDGDAVVGTQAFVAHEMNVNGKVLLTGRSERTLVSAKYRGQDIFANLMDHCVRRGTEKGQKFFWGAGTDALKAFKRCGYSEITGHREYLASVVDTKNLLKQLCSKKGISALRPSAVWQASRARDVDKLTYSAQLALSPVLAGARLPAAALGLFGRSVKVEFTRSPKNATDIDGLYVRLRGQGNLMHLRHCPSFHNWILDGGNHETNWFFAYRAGELVAYACLELTDAVSGKIIDFAAAESAVFYSLLEELRRAAGQQNRTFVTVVCNRHNQQQKSLYGAFYAAGFVPFLRGGKSVVRAGVYQDMNVLSNAASWYMTDFWSILHRSKDASLPTN